jgi:hypothetical protein
LLTKINLWIFFWLNLAATAKYSENISNQRNPLSFNLASWDA